jgi:hypothetical protein
MQLYIPIEEFEEEYQGAWIRKELTSPSIDYATNAIHCWLKEKDIIIFKFKDFGFINNNCYNTYNLTHDEEGITINITRPRMYKFELDETQIKEFEKWKKKQKKKDPSTFTAGERWTFKFTPTGLGLMVHVKDNITEEEIDLTDWDNF